MEVHTMSTTEDESADWRRVYRLGLDPVSGTSLHYASFLLKHFVPLELVRDEAHYKIIEGDLDESYPSFVSLPSDTKDQTWSFITGSRAEGLGVPGYWLGGPGKVAVASDRDEMYCAPNWYHLELPAEAQQYSQGPLFDIEQLDDGDPNSKNYARLRISDSLRMARLAQGNPVKSTYFDNNQLKLSAYNKYKLHERAAKAHFDIEIHGPSVSMVGNRFGPMFDRDECISIVFAHWPDVAAEWSRRLRPSGWPSKALVADLCTKGFFMVPVGRHNSSCPELEWRYSFSLAERTLARSLSPVIRKTYILVKLLHSFFLKQPSVLPTYALKTALFWFCEKHDVSQWSESDMGRLLYCFVDEIIHCLAVKDIRHYFIPCVNLLGSASMDSLRTVTKKLLHIRHNLLTSITSIASQVQFWGLLSIKPFSQLRNYKQFVHRSKSPQKFELFRGACIDMLNDIFIEYIRTMKIMEDQSDAGETGLQKQMYRQRFLRLLREWFDEMKLLEEDTSPYGDFILRKLLHCDLGQSDMMANPEHFMVKVFTWICTDNSRTSTAELLEVCNKVISYLPVGNTLQQKALARAKKMVEYLQTTEIPVVPLKPNSYKAIKEYITRSASNTRHETIRMLEGSLAKLPHQKVVGAPTMLEVQSWSGRSDTILQNCNMKGRACCYRHGVELSSGTSLHHASFFLRHFLPVKFVDDFVQQKIIESDVRMAEMDHSDLASVEMTGSLAEGLGVPDYYLSHEAGLVVDAADAVELICNHTWYNFDDIPVEFGHYREGPMLEVQEINGDRARLKIASGYKLALNTVRNETVSEEYLESLEGIQKMFSVEDVKTVSGEDSRRLAMAFKGWPKAAAGWLTRHRPTGWPNEAVITNIRNKGFLMVSAECEDSKTVSWKYSFSLAERALGRSLPVMVRKAYILLRLLCAFHIGKSQAKILSTYCLRTLLFWFCEKHFVSHWSEAEMAGLLYCVLDWAISALVTQEIQHYFIPSINLLQQRSPQDVKAVAKMLADVRQNLLEYIFAVAKQLRFHGLGKRCITDLPSVSLFMTTATSPTDIGRFCSVSITFLSDLFVEYVDCVCQVEELGDTGSVGLLKQAMRLRFLRIMGDLIEEMKCAESFRGLYGSYLLLRLSELLNQQTVILSKLFVWLSYYHKHFGMEPAEIAGDDKKQSQSTDAIFSMARDLIKERDDALVEEQLTQVQKIREYVNSPFPGDELVKPVEIPRESSMIYKQYYNLLAGRAVESLVDTDDMPTLSVQQSSESSIQLSSASQLTDQMQQLTTLLGQMSGAPAGDLSRLLRQTQQVFAWVQSQQGQK